MQLPLQASYFNNQGGEKLIRLEINVFKIYFIFTNRAMTNFTLQFISIKQMLHVQFTGTSS